MIEAHRFARDLDPLAGEKGEEQILDALGRIFAERFVQDPGVVGVEVKGELLFFEPEIFSCAMPSTTCWMACMSAALFFQSAYLTPPVVTYFPSKLL